MGLIIDILRQPNRADCTNGGVSSQVTQLCLVNASGPFEPSDAAPAVIMQEHVRGCLRIVRAYQDRSGRWCADKYNMSMMGGNYAASSDSRFATLCETLLNHRFYGAVAIHDRVE